MKLSLKLNDDERICNVLGLMLFGLYIVNISPGFEEPLGIPHSIISTMVKIILGLGFLSCIDIIFRRFEKILLMYCLTAATVIFISVIVFPSNNVVFKSTAIYFLANCLLPMIFFGMVHDFQCLKQKLLRTSEIIALLTILVLALRVGIIGLGFQFSFGYYSMGFGYACLVPCLFLIMEFVRKPAFKYGIYVMVILTAIMTLGSRGPLAGILSFMGITFVKINHEKGKDVRIVLGILTGLLFLTFSGALFKYLYNFLYGMGIDSRTLVMLSSNRISDMSGRDKLYQVFLNEIVSNPFAIRGINRDQVLGLNYPHNIFLELLYQLGIVFGGLIAITIVLKGLKTLKLKYVNIDSSQQLEIVYMCACLPTLMISDTLWTQINFWIWVSISDNRWRAYINGIGRKHK